MIIWATNALAWLRERWLFVAGALVTVVLVLWAMLRREQTRRAAAEARAEWQHAVATSEARRRVRVLAAEHARETARASTWNERWAAYRRADDRRSEIYSAGDDLGQLFDRTYRAGREKSRQ